MILLGANLDKLKFTYEYRLSEYLIQLQFLKLFL